MDKHGALKPFNFDSSRMDDQSLSQKADDGAVSGAEALVRKRLHNQEEGDHSKRRNLESSSVINSDILMSDDSERITHSIYKTSSRPSVASSESIYIFNRVPSSPPSVLRSDDIASSPNRSIELTASQATVVPVHFESDGDDSDSTVDFNINTLNKITGYISSDYLTSEPNYPLNDEDVSITAKGHISQCIEDGYPKVHLEGMGLKVLPDDVEDLRNMVCWGVHGLEVPRIELYATHNNLRILPPCLFNVEQLVVLSLRVNKLKKIPGIIWKLKNLMDLSVASNEIRVLPYQTLKLSRLVNLLIRPNPGLIELRDQDPSSYFCIADQNPDHSVDVCRYVSKIKWSHHPSHKSAAPMTDRDIANTVSPVPKLSELALRKFCNYSVTLTETRLWKKTIPVYTQKMITKALQKGIYDESCSVCDKVTVNPIAKSLEWWDFKSQTLVPIRRNFCCGNCVQSWLNDVEPAIEQYKQRKQ
jgi:hypothetical protein